MLDHFWNSISSLMYIWFKFCCQGFFLAYPAQCIIVHSAYVFVDEYSVSGCEVNSEYPVKTYHIPSYTDTTQIYRHPDVNRRVVEDSYRPFLN